MSRTRFATAAVICILAGAATALASWYDDYDDGIEAARKGQWQVVVQKMSAAIAGNPKEGDKTRTYGAIFISYHPYYYRGVANLNLGRYEQAIKDFEITSGPGEENLGSLETLMQRAKSKLAAASAPPPVEAPAARPTPPPVQQPQATQTPAAPAVDPALRARARTALDQAKGRLQAAVQRKASASPSYSQALQQYTDANTRWASARSNDDLNAVLAAADNISMLADSAQAPGLPAPPPVAQTRPAAASAAVLADPSRRVRHALESYFAGDFDEAATAFQALTNDMPTNPWIWAFLGASKYSLYAFEADETYKADALTAFRKAKKFRTFRNGLPEKYFSRKIRKAFSETSG